MCIYIITQIYIISWYLVHYAHYVGLFCFGSSKLMKRFQALIMTVQWETLPSVILGNTHMYTSMWVPLHVYIIHTQTQTHTHCIVTLTILITRKNHHSVNPKATQLNNMVDKITLRLMEFLIVFLVTTWNQLLLMYLVRLQNLYLRLHLMYMCWKMTLKHVTESVYINPMEIQRKLPFTLLIAHIANVL